MENIAKQYQEETISAVCTALGEGAIGIIRISGENALAAGEAILRQPPEENWLIILEILWFTDMYMMQTAAWLTK